MEVGVRELRDGLSRHLAEVRCGRPYPKQPILSPWRHWLEHTECHKWMIANTRDACNVSTSSGHKSR